MSKEKSSHSKNKLSWFEDLEAYKKIRDIENYRRERYQRLGQDGSAATDQGLEFTQCMYLDFVRVFLKMNEAVWAEQIMAETKASSKQKTKKLKTYQKQTVDKINDLLGSFFRYLIYKTEPVLSFKQIVPNEIKVTEHNNLWIPPDFSTHIQELFKSVLKSQTGDHQKILEDQMESEQNIIRMWMYFLNLSEDAVRIALVPQAFSELRMRQVSYCLAMRALLTYRLLGSFHPLLLGESLRGSSGLPRFFDGTITILDKKTTPNIYLTKTSSLGSTGISIINNFCVSLIDVKDILDEKVGGILFLPGYPTPDTLKTELHWRETERLNVTVLYLADFCELFRIWDSKKIERFLMERTR